MNVSICNISGSIVTEKGSYSPQIASKAITSVLKELSDCAKKLNTNCVTKTYGERKVTALFTGNIVLVKLKEGNFYTDIGSVWDFVPRFKEINGKCINILSQFYIFQ